MLIETSGVTIPIPIPIPIPIVIPIPPTSVQDLPIYNFQPNYSSSEQMFGYNTCFSRNLFSSPWALWYIARVEAMMTQCQRHERQTPPSSDE